MKIAYFDCFAGISGDMLLGVLLDLGLDLAALERELRKLPLAGYRLEAARVNKRGIQATKFNVILTGSEGDHLADSEFQEVAQPTSGMDHPPDHHHPDQPQRPLAEILSLIERSSLSDRVKATATAIFTRLGQAEAQVHGVSLEQVHFHEVGGVDAIVDIVGAAIALEELGVERVYASPLHLGSGFVRAAHGLLPVPAPATAHLIAGVPIYSSEVKGELVTPTGAAIITTIAQFRPLPPLVIEAAATARERATGNFSKRAARLSGPQPQPGCPALLLPAARCATRSRSSTRHPKSAPVITKARRRSLKPILTI